MTPTQRKIFTAYAAEPWRIDMLARTNDVPTEVAAAGLIAELLRLIEAKERGCIVCSAPSV